MPFPPAGSFQDAVLREVLFRERNRQYAVSAAMVSSVEAIGHVLLDWLPPVPPKDEAAYRARHAPLTERFAKILAFLEGEIFEERYMDGYVREEAKKARAAREAALERQAREAAARARIATWHRE